MLNNYTKLCENSANDLNRKVRAKTIKRYAVYLGRALTVLATVFGLWVVIVVAFSMGV